MDILEKRFCSVIVQYATPALPTVQKKAKDRDNDKTTEQDTTLTCKCSDKKQECNTCLLLKSTSNKYRLRRKEQFIVSLTTPLDFPAIGSEVHFTNSTSYQLQTSNLVTASATHTAHCLLNAGASVILIR